MSVTIVRLEDNTVLTPVFSHDGENLRWWNRESSITHLRVRGAGIPGAEVVFQVHDGDDIHVTAVVLRTDIPIPINQEISPEMIEEINVPEGFTLYGYTPLDPVN